MRHAHSDWQSIIVIPTNNGANFYTLKISKIGNIQKWLLYKCRQDDVSGDAYVNLGWTKHFDYTGIF